MKNDIISRYLGIIIFIYAPDILYAYFKMFLTNEYILIFWIPLRARGMLNSKITYIQFED